MITQEELTVLVQQLNKVPMDHAQMYAVQTILDKLSELVEASNEAQPESTT